VGTLQEHSETCPLAARSRLYAPSRENTDKQAMRQTAVMIRLFIASPPLIAKSRLAHRTVKQTVLKQMKFVIF
jgi:hypothetical protein